MLCAFFVSLREREREREREGGGSNVIQRISLCLLFHFRYSQIIIPEGIDDEHLDNFSLYSNIFSFIELHVYYADGKFGNFRDNLIFANVREFGASRIQGSH